MNNNIELQIEELVLQGFPPNDQGAIGEAVQLELARLFTEHGVPGSLGQGGNIADLEGGHFNAPAGLGPAETGARIAQAVYDAVCRGSER